MGHLNNIRVLEMSRFWAGPHCTQLLADMGAQVIKVEDESGDGMRSVIHTRSGSHVEGVFVFINRNKLGISLALHKEEGRELCRQLAKVSDVVVENFVPGTMESMGLGYEVLRALKPDIIMISLSGHGQTGRNRSLRALGVTTEPYCFSSVTGYSDDEIPMRSGVDHSDPFSGTHAAGAILAALLCRQRTGEGQHIDLSFVEAGITVLGDAFVDYSMNKRIPSRVGNKHPYMAPHGCYRCKGTDKWVAIAVGSNEEWDRLCQVMGRPPWTREERFKDMLSRWHNQGELNKLVELWTLGHEHYDVMSMLQEASIAAGAVLSTDEVMNDQHLKERNFYQTLAHPQAGSFPHIGGRWKPTREPLSIRFAAPLYGQHNEYVLTQLLDYGKDIIDELNKNDVILAKTRQKV